MSRRKHNRKPAPAAGHMNPETLRAIREQYATLKDNEIQSFADLWAYTSNIATLRASHGMQHVAKRLRIAPACDTALVCGYIVHKGMTHIRTYDAIQDLAIALCGNYVLNRMRCAESDMINLLANGIVSNDTTAEELKTLRTAPPSAVADLCGEIYEIATPEHAFAWIEYFAYSILGRRAVDREPVIR